MSDLLSDLEFIQVHIDDAITFTKGSWEDHLNELKIALQCLQHSGLKMNAKKSFFGRMETECVPGALHRLQRNAAFNHEGTGHSEHKTSENT